MGEMPPSDTQRWPSPLRYPGGKGKIANFLKLLFVENQLAGYDYAEPYAGGASVALQLLYEEYASRIHINDLNRSVYAFWRAVLHDTDGLCGRINSARLSVTEWKRQKAVQSATQPAPLDLAFSTFYLNRTNRSGIVDGGLIGGKDQGGPWKLDARFNKVELIRRIQKVARYQSRITLTNLDAADLMRTTYRRLPDTTFVYLDPPYYVKGAGLYENAYQHDDHVSIATLVSSMNRSWVVSYDAEPAILAMYRHFRRITYGLHYSAGDRYAGAEVMYFSHDLDIPQVITPANVKSKAVDRSRREAFAHA
jgi:DNA adenine methylase